MLAPTHGVFGVFLTLIILAVFGIQESLHWSILLVAVIGSMMPDLDHPRSLVGRLFFFVSIPLERKFGHRTVTHSILGWAISTALAAVVIGLTWLVYHSLIQPRFPLPIISSALAIRWIAAFSIGYLSHILIDMVNPRGVQLFWPNDARDVISKNPDLRPESGSKAEVLIFALLVGLMILSFPLSKYGLMTSLRWLLATPEAAIEEFKNTSTKTYVTFTGIFAETRLPVKGKAEILEAKNKRLVIDYENHIYSLSDEVSADIIASQVRVQKTTIPISITKKSFAPQSKEDLLARLPDDTLICGTIQLPKDLIIHHLPASMTQVGNDLTLHFATKDQLKALQIDDAFALIQKQDATKQAKITHEIRQTQNQLDDLNDTKGLTPLGAQLLSTPKERDEKARKAEELTQRLADLQLDLAKQQLTQKSHTLVFSGDIILRR